jgi:hypothetical protein
MGTMPFMGTRNASSTIKHVIELCATCYLCTGLGGTLNPKPCTENAHTARVCAHAPQALIYRLNRHIGKDHKAAGALVRSDHNAHPHQQGAGVVSTRGCFALDC